MQHERILEEDLGDHREELARVLGAKLTETYQRLIKELSLFRMRALGGGGGLSVSADEHGEIVNAIASRDPQRAGTALRRHVADSRARMHKALGREPAAPSSSSALSSTKEA